MSEPARRFFALELAYDGSGFCGWQIQPGRRTVQGEIQGWLARILNQPIVLTGAGRTDTGVHATGSLCSFPASTAIGADRLLHSLQQVLDEDIRVYRLHEFEDPAFSARYSAQAREYHYRLHPGADPFARRQAWCLPFEPDVQRMERALLPLAGQCDCRGFCVTRSLPPTAISDFGEARLERNGPYLEVVLRADRFLHSQVRSITGTLVEIGRGVFGEDRLAEVLATGRRDLCGTLAPPQGLHLSGVVYPRFRTGLKPGQRDGRGQEALPSTVYWPGVSRSPRQQFTGGAAPDSTGQTSDIKSESQPERNEP